MAGHGLRVRNATTGSIQIDQNYYNPAVFSKQVLTSPSTRVPGYSAEVSYLEVTFVSLSFPIVAVASGSAIFPLGMTRNGNSWTFHYYIGGLGREVTFYAFGRPLPLPPGFGVRTKTFGELNFDSRHRYLRRTARVGLGSGTLPGGATYAAILSNPGYWHQKEIQNLGGFWRYSELISKGGMLLNGTDYNYANGTLHFAIRETNFNPGQPYTYASPAQDALIIDVTGY